MGHVAGDLLTVDMAKLTDSEVLLSGPPCTPWAPNGLKKGTLDERADVYERVSDWILELAYRGVLVIFLLENSAKLINTDFFKDMVTKLRVAFPFFRIDWVEHDLT